MVTTRYTEEEGGKGNADRLFWFKHLHMTQFLVLALAREFTVPTDRATSITQVIPTLLFKNA